MISTCLIALLITTAPDTGSLVQDLADTSRIRQSIELSQQLYETFENESSLTHASLALTLSKHLFDTQLAEPNEQTLRIVKPLITKSYVMYARVLREFDLQAAEDSLMAGLEWLEETDTSEIAAIYSELGSTYERMGQEDKALSYSKMALELFEASGDQYSYMYQMIKIGLVLRGMGSYGEALEYFMESLRVGRQLNDSTAIVESLLAMGFVYAFVGKWEEALSSQREALRIYQEDNDQQGIARIHNDMGVTYNLAGELDSALAHHQKALELRLESNDMYNTFASYAYIGDILAKKEDFSGAIQYYETGLPYGNQSGFKVTVVDAYLNLGKYYLQINDSENALKNFEFALQLSDEIGDAAGKSRANTGLAGVAVFKGEYDVAIERLNLAEETTPETNFKIKRELYKEISEVYFNLGDYENAYLNSLIYSDVKDSVMAAENLSRITQLTNVMAFENEMALDRESNEKMMALKQIEINRERLARNIFLAAMLLAVIMVGIIFVRFIEKKKLSDKLNDTLKNLQATQSQLIQQEKLASLGQLTAGIAHEIKNPLNFVNNFSEVSLEMINEARSEVKSERKTPDFKEVDNPGVLLTILDDIEANLRTIHKHGTRADSIVKSMLHHSRGGSGKMDPTPLNPLIKEYVNLAFHGMRAGKNPINVDIELQLDESVGEVPIIAEDFSRVILNLCNNAFDAMREKARGKDLQGFKNLEGLQVDYHPKLTVRTRSENAHITIEIEDNGPGIPDEIKDKILQPFFTTKKGTQGTGLGLSITNDIVKAHGGTMNIDSQPGQTIFTIKFNR